MPASSPSSSSTRGRRRRGDRLRELLASMGLGVRQIRREKGTPFAAYDLGNAACIDDQLLTVAQHPVLMNRLIVETPLGTALCRPSEAVLALLPVGPLPPFTKTASSCTTTASACRAAERERPGRGPCRSAAAGPEVSLRSIGRPLLRRRPCPPTRQRSSSPRPAWTATSRALHGRAGAHDRRLAAARLALAADRLRDRQQPDRGRTQQAGGALPGERRERPRVHRLGPVVGEPRGPCCGWSLYDTPSSSPASTSARAAQRSISPSSSARRSAWTHATPRWHVEREGTGFMRLRRDRVDAHGGQRTRRCG